MTADFTVTMPDPTQPKTPAAEPHTETTPKESIRPAQEEFVGDEAQPSRDKSEYEADRGGQSSDRGVEDGQLPGGADGGSQSSDRAVEDASLSNMATDVAEDEEDDNLDEDDDGEDDEDSLGEDDENLDEDEEEADATPGAATRVLVGA